MVKGITARVCRAGAGLVVALVRIESWTHVPLTRKGKEGLTTSVDAAKPYRPTIQALERGPENRTARSPIAAAV